MERLQKLLSAAGICSRRDAEELIRSGRVAVNGVTAVLGQKADPLNDLVTLDGRRVNPGGRLEYLVINKPAGVVTTLSDEKGRKCVKDLVRTRSRVFPVGRLDMYSEGLLILTNDGEFAHIMEHPSGSVEKEYLVRLKGDRTQDHAKLSQPFELDGATVRARVRLLSATPENSLLSVTLTEGKNREIRRMCSHLGFHVLQIRRIREGEIRLGDLKSGAWRHFTDKELEYIDKLKRERDGSIE